MLQPRRHRQIDIRGHALMQEDMVRRNAEPIAGPTSLVAYALDRLVPKNFQI